MLEASLEHCHKHAHRKLTRRPTHRSVVEPAPYCADGGAARVSGVPCACPAPSACIVMRALARRYQWPVVRSDSGTDTGWATKWTLLPDVVEETLDARGGAAVTARFNMEISRQRIEARHPEHAGSNLDAKWRDAFDITRVRLLVELDDIPMAHCAYRLRELGRLAMQAERRSNVVLATRTIEQAARKTGNQ